MAIRVTATYPAQEEHSAENCRENHRERAVAGELRRSGTEIIHMAAFCIQPGNGLEIRPLSVCAQREIGRLVARGFYRLSGLASAGQTGCEAATMIGLWGRVHGAAVLAIDGLLDRIVGTDTPQALDVVLENVFR